MRRLPLGSPASFGHGERCSGGALAGRNESELKSPAHDCNAGRLRAVAFEYTALQTMQSSRSGQIFLTGTYHRVLRPEPDHGLVVKPQVREHSRCPE